MKTFALILLLAGVLLLGAAVVWFNFSYSNNALPKMADEYSANAIRLYSEAAKVRPSVEELRLIEQGKSSEASAAGIRETVDLAKFWPTIWAIGGGVAVALASLLLLVGRLKQLANQSPMLVIFMLQK